MDEVGVVEGLASKEYSSTCCSGSGARMSDMFGEPGRVVWWPLVRGRETGVEGGALPEGISSEFLRESERVGGGPIANPV